MSHQTCLHLAILREEERLVRWSTKRGGGRLWYLILWLFLLLKRRWSTLALCLHGVILVSHSHTCWLLILLRSKVLRHRLLLIRRSWILLEKASWGAVLKLNAPASLISGTTNQTLFANRALYGSNLSSCTFSINLLRIIFIGVVDGWVCCTDVREARLISILRLNCLDHLLTWCWFLILWLNWEGIGC